MSEFCFPVPSTALLHPHPAPLPLVLLVFPSFSHCLFFLLMQSRFSSTLTLYSLSLVCLPAVLVPGTEHQCGHLSRSVSDLICSALSFGVMRSSSRHSGNCCMEASLFLFNIFNFLCFYKFLIKIHVACSSKHSLQY